jgi:very-short-patch-repair endonuclease
MLGYKIIRFKYDEVENKLGEVINEIRANIEKLISK